MLSAHRFPQLLILSDGVPSKNGGGISQTLYNLFKNYTPEKLVLIANKSEFIDSADNILKGSSLKVTINILPIVKNRFSSIINPIFFVLNCWWRELGFTSLHKSFVLEADSYLLISTTHLDKLHYAYCLKKKYNIKLITYYMDNWVEDIRTQWFTGNTQQLVENTLSKASGLLFISEHLQKNFTKKYNIASSKPFLCIHNPVEINASDIEHISIEQWRDCNSITVTYAGSIWPMHYDALLVIAKAICILKKMNINIELQLFCANHFWEKYKPELELLQVTYNGFVDYKHLNKALQKSHFLLVASSFEHTFLSFSLSSIQTKLTDYMKAGKPIISIGPQHGACNLFVEKYDCGYALYSNDEHTVSQNIRSIINDVNKNYQKAINGFQSAYNNFREDVVQHKLYNFISSLN